MGANPAFLMTRWPYRVWGYSGQVARPADARPPTQSGVPEKSSMARLRRQMTEAREVAGYYLTLLRLNGIEPQAMPASDYSWLPDSKEREENDG